MKLIELVCPECGVTFKRREAEHTRNQKRGSTSYCSLACANLQSRAKRYGPAHRFLFYATGAKKSAKAKNLEFDLTPEYLKILYIVYL